MNPGRFYMPQYIGIGNNMLRNGMRMPVPMAKITNSVSRGTGLFSKITSGIRSVNWGGLLNNANKTLNVVNQTIPLVRQAGPMVNNMKSMLRIAKAFGNETANKIPKNNLPINNQHKNNFTKIDNNSNNINHNTNNTKNIEKKEEQQNNIPVFFV